MAPSPVLNIEPKGPDKNAEKCIESVSSKEKQNMPKIVDDNATSKEKISVDQLSFAEIEEAGLKSLLDEAYSYKSPKDRLGKSNLFQVLLNEVEENDTSKKKLSERSNSFADGRGNASVSIGNGHDTANDKAFLNILGGCEKEKKKKKNKRDGSGANSGSRRPKFSHSLKINHGPQSSSHIYNGNSASSNVHYNGSSRSLSRAHQSFNGRISNSKTAPLLTSSSNIDIPMVTTSNKQPIMTPALVPSTQKATELVMLDLREQNGKAVDDTAVICNKSSSNAENENDAIEMKILETKNNDSVYNYTTHASLEIGGGVDGCVKQFNDSEKDNTDAAAVIFPLQSSGALTNGNAERSSIQHSQKPVNGLSDEKEEVDNVISNNNNTENEEDKHSKKKNKKKQAPSLDNINDSSNRTSIYATSVDEPKTMTSLLQKSAQNSSTNNSAYKFPTESSFPYPWHYPNVILTLTGESMASIGRNICTKESLESRQRLYDENTASSNSSYPYLNNNSASMNKERLDNGSERKHKIRKPKKQNTTSVLSENIEGYCGDKSVEYLLDYIENTKSGGEGGSGNGGGVVVKSLKSKLTGSAARIGDKSNKNNISNNNKASTDDDVRSKKPNKVKERLNKSTSLEDLRRSSSKSKQPNKKQSSVDDSHYMAKEVEIVEIQPSEFKGLSDDSSHLYYDSIDHVDDDNYTEEFHLVTKKQRKKKRRSKSRTLDQKHMHDMSQNFLPHNYTDKNDNGNFAYQNSKRSTRSSENRHRSRRKSVSSVVPSDKISDSDSIHSLPVSSTTPKCKIKKKSTSSGCTPQASYADIAKSPQCNSSTTLNGDSAKWHSSLKTFSNSPSAYSTQNTSGSTTASSFSSSASSSNTGDTPEHSDNSELVSNRAVSSSKGEDVASDESCDQLLLTNNNNNSFNEHTANPVSPNENDSGVAECELTLKRKSKSKTRSTENDTNNNTSMVNNVNGIHNKSPKDYHSNVNSNTICNNSNNSVNHNSNNNTNTTKVKKSRNKKNKNNNVDDNDINDNHTEDTVKNGNDLSIEFTLKYIPSTTTKSSETQTDLESVEVNNNACNRYHSNSNGCNDITVEETIVLKSNKNVPTDGSYSQTSVDKLSHSLPINNETGQTVLLLNDNNSNNSAAGEITVGFDVNEQLLEDASKERQQDVEKEVIERSSKYNVTEVIQYVNKSWNEVLKNLTSSKVATSNKKIQYYVGK